MKGELQIPTRMLHRPRLTISAPPVFCALLLAGSCLATWLPAAALEHGHVRARTRAFVYDPATEGGEQNGYSTQEMDSGDIESGRDRAEQSLEANEPGRPAVSSSVSGVRARGFSKRMVAWPWAEKEFRANHVGYLAEQSPHALRFSDVDDANRRPPSPALPEFSVMSSEYPPYLIEEPIAGDAMNDPELLSEIVVELEPHTITSGVINTAEVKQEEKVEHFELEEKRAAVLRPEEVLIFFEADNQGRNTGAVIPFAPATPSAETIESSARYKKE